MSRIVELRDQRPLTVRRDEIQTETIRICRCGLSANWPWCDDSHKAARGEEPHKVYRYVRDVPSGQLMRFEVALQETERPSTAQSPSGPEPESLI